MRGRDVLDRRTLHRTVCAAKFSADRGYLDGARAETLGVKDAERCHFGGSGPNGRRLRGLQIACGLLAPLGHDVIADFLTFHEAAHTGALDRADVHEHVLAAVARLDESKAFLSIEELHGTCGHPGLLHCNEYVYPITRASRGRSSNFGGASWAP